MYELIGIVVAVALLGGLLVFPALLLLAKLGHFEPLEVELFGKRYLFAPKRPRLTVAFSNSGVVTFPARQTAFASVVTAVLVIGSSDVTVTRAAGIASGSTGTAILKEAA